MANAEDDCPTPAGSCAVGGCGTDGVILPDNPVDSGTWVCGTGNLTTIVPPIGDPTYGEVTLVAQGGLDQITVRWTWPSKFPQGVAFCTLYRGTGANVGFAGCSRLAEIGGNIYTDSIKSDLDPENISAVTNYTYWVKFTSVNGVVSEAYGPAWDFPYDTVQSVLDGMENRIQNTQLAKDLRTEIDKITDISSGLSDEHQNRLFGDSYLSAAWGSVDRTMADIDAKIIDYQDTIVTEEMAMAIRISGLFTVFENNAAAITIEQIALSDDNRAFASSIKTLQAEYNGSTASLQELMYVTAGKKPVLDSATGLPVFPPVYYETGELSLSSQYSLKTDVKNDVTGKRLVTGFGLYNDGTSSEFIVNATDFAIGLVKPYVDTVDGLSPIPAVYPFIVGYVGGKPVVSMNAKTFIQDGTIITANIADKISSSDYNYDAGKGWALFQGIPQGNPKRTDAVGHPSHPGVDPTESWADFANVRVRGDVEANTISANAVSIVDTKTLVPQSVTFARAVRGQTGQTNGDGTSGLNIGGGSFNPLGGSLFVTASMTVQPSSDDSVYIVLIVGSNTTRAQVYANDGSESGAATIIVPCSLSEVSAYNDGGTFEQSKVIEWSCYANGYGSISNPVFSISGYKR